MAAVRSAATAMLPWIASAALVCGEVHSEQIGGAIIIVEDQGFTDWTPDSAPASPVDACLLE